MKDTEIPFDKISDNEAIVGGRYVVTTQGEVFGLRKNGRRRLLTPRKHTSGYLRIAYCDGSGVQLDVFIHRLVARIFIENPKDFKEVNHKDGDKTNNHASNLEWCSRRMNNLHAFKTGLRKYSELAEMARRPRPKARLLTRSDILRIRGEEFLVGNTALGRKYGINKESIRKIKLRKTYKEVS